MPEQPDFLQRVKQELSAEGVADLQTYNAQTDRGRPLFIPIIRKMGGQVQWVSKVFGIRERSQISWIHHQVLAAREDRMEWLKIRLG